MFSEKDIHYLKEQGVSAASVEQQIDVFNRGIQSVNITRPAVRDDGIEVFDEDGSLMYAGLFDKHAHSYKKTKFIPASGAATRMFRDLFEARNHFQADLQNINKWIDNNDDIKNFFLSVSKYPFIDDLSGICRKNGKTPEKMIEDKQYSELLGFILDTNGLNYGSLPKGLLKFHKYKDGSRTPFEEHIDEASGYLVNADHSLNIHFTVSPEHMKWFRELSKFAGEIYAGKGIFLNVDFSVQDKSTDTIAVDLNNKPFRSEDGTLLFRPGGHGALLNNLENLQEDIIFISNIDNVATSRHMPKRVLYKKMLGGFLIEKLHVIRQLLENMKSKYSIAVRKDVLEFVKKYISSELFSVLNEMKDHDFVSEAFRILNRPVRVCGMIKNSGEPGGGPFWVKTHKGYSFKQIIESAQIDFTDTEQSRSFSASTHFNPVDIACCIKDFRGSKFKLREFRDDSMFFISAKSIGGRKLKALELPGLWNGGMAGWITFFIEVPADTFSPVKTVFDLMRPEHQE